ncbi:hypothetical protein Tco_1227722 [Tanacetum coccineum]
MDEFVKFATKERESLESVYERLTTLVNIMDHDNVRPIQVSINTKFLNCLQPKWSKYVTQVRHNQSGNAVSYDVLYDSLVQFEPHVLASKARKVAKNHEPLALIAKSIASSSNSSYSPQPYYVAHPSSVVIEGAQREQGHRKVRAETAVIVLTERVAELERDNKRLRGTASVESQRDGRLQRGMARMQINVMKLIFIYDMIS